MGSKQNLEELFVGKKWPLSFILSKQFMLFIDLIPDAVIFSKTDGSVVQINEQADKLFKYNRSEFLELTIEDLVPDKN